MAVIEFSDASELSSPPPARETAERAGSRDREPSIVPLKADRFGFAAHWARSMRG